MGSVPENLKEISHGGEMPAKNRQLFDFGINKRVPTQRLKPSNSGLKLYSERVNTCQAFSASSISPRRVQTP